jgi:ketosteroid isomerase-like protein
MSPEQRHAAEIEATRVLQRFFHNLDNRNYDALAALMAGDGVWHRQGKALRGPAGVLEAMAARPKDATTRHIITNLVVDAIDANHVEAAFYMTVFGRSGPAVAGETAPVELPLTVAACQEKLVLTDAGWRIAEITSQPTFKR